MYVIILGKINLVRCTTPYTVNEINEDPFRRPNKITLIGDCSLID